MPLRLPGRQWGMQCNGTRPATLGWDLKAVLIRPVGSSARGQTAFLCSKGMRLQRPVCESDGVSRWISCFSKQERLCRTTRTQTHNFNHSWPICSGRKCASRQWRHRTRSCPAICRRTLKGALRQEVLLMTGRTAPALPICPCSLLPCSLLWQVGQNMCSIRRSFCPCFSDSLCFSCSATL